MTTKRGVFCVLSVAFTKPEQQAAFMAGIPFGERARLSAAGIAIQDSDLFGEEHTVAGKTLKEALTKIAATGFEIEKRDVASWEKTSAGEIRLVTKGKVARDATMKLFAAWLKKRAKAGETFFAVTDTKKRFAITGYLESYDDYTFLEEGLLLIVALASAHGAKARVGFWGDVSLLEEAVYLGVSAEGETLEEVRYIEAQNITDEDAAQFYARFAIDGDAITAAHATWLDGFAEKKMLAMYGGNSGFIRPDGTYAIEPLLAELGGFHEGRALFRGPRWTWGYIDESGKEVIPAEFTFAYDFKDGRARVKKQVLNEALPNGASRTLDKFGFIDREGTFVIPPIFGAVEDFSDGRALVTAEFGKLGFIDESGEIVIPMTLDWASSFSDARALVCEGDRYAGGKWGYLDTSGAWFIPPTYGSASAFYRGHAIVMREGLWGVIDAHGTETIAINLKYAELLAEGGLIGAPGPGKGVYAFDGREIVPPEYMRIAERGEVYEAMSADTMRVFFTRDGRPVGKLRVINNDIAAEGLIPVQWAIDGLWGYADLNGETVIPPTYAAAFAFGQGRAVVRDAKGILIIDREGREVARPSLELYLRHATAFGASGVAIVTSYKSALVALDGRVLIGPHLKGASGLADERIWVKFAEQS